jgi:cytochrome c oxidase cbb3-type subunit 2
MKPEHESKKLLSHKLDKSALLTVIGIIFLFSSAILVTLITPGWVDPSWIQPTTPYQAQMYEVADPNIYINSSGAERFTVYHLREHYTLLAFQEEEYVRILAPAHLKQYITQFGVPTLKLTSKLLLLRTPLPESEFAAKADTMRKELQQVWIESHPDAEKQGIFKPVYYILELYAPSGKESFALAPASDGVIESWVDKDFIILDTQIQEPYHRSSGVIYVKNPQEYRIIQVNTRSTPFWKYDEQGRSILSLQELQSHALHFVSRQELIQEGEKRYAAEGCWYCHTDQTRTLIQDLVLNGSDSYPAPPSSANEYIYQKITFPGTRRIGPDLSRVGVKRPSRDWHRSHFWSPKTASLGSIMPSFKHFFDDDPRGALDLLPVPNYTFEAIFQYLMTKGTRITPPTQAWWLGKDPIRTKEVIEGKRKLS